MKERYNMACKECKNCKMYCKANNLSHNNRCLYENFECIFRMGYKYKGSSYDDYKIDKYGNEILSDYFYSNCLIEALVARHKNNSYQVRSISIYHHKVKGQLFHHYTWTFENDDWIYEFGTDHKIFSILRYKGYLSRHKKSSNNIL